MVRPPFLTSSILSNLICTNRHIIRPHTDRDKQVLGLHKNIVVDAVIQSVLKLLVKKLSAIFI
jgi:hypothetical protein